MRSPCVRSPWGQIFSTLPYEGRGRTGRPHQAAPTCSPCCASFIADMGIDGRKLHIQQIRDFKSASGLGTVELSPLTIIAGVNGSGKTHLLKAIKDGAVRVSLDSVQIDPEDVEYYDWATFAMEDQREVSQSQLRVAAENEWRQIRRTIGGGAVTKVVNERRGSLPVSLSPEQLLSGKLADFPPDEGFQSAVDAIRRQCRQALLDSLSQFAAKIVFAEQLTGESVFEMSEDSYISSVLAYVEPGRLLQQRVNSVFIAYNSVKDDNESRMLRAQHLGMALPFLSDEEFRGRYGPPPWEILNKVLSDMQLDLQATAPEPMQPTYNIAFVQHSTGIAVGLTDLSSGERVLIALALSLYGAAAIRGKPRLPKVLLLDEVEAPLHPAMVRVYLNTVQEVLVASGVAVLMTTHSPTTVALAPECHVWEMRKHEPRLVSVSNQRALSKLTVGVAALSVRLQKNRVVLVEAHADAAEYAAMMDALRAYIECEWSAVFLSAGVTKEAGGCALVKKRVREFRTACVNEVFGLIDYDGKNQVNREEGIIVLGGDARYSLENYVFDPLLIAALCIREKKANVIRGLEQELAGETGTWRGLEHASVDKLQKVADLALEMISADDVNDTSVVDCCGTCQRK